MTKNLQLIARCSARLTHILYLYTFFLKWLLFQKQCFNLTDYFCLQRFIKTRQRIYNWFLCVLHDWLMLYDFWKIGKLYIMLRELTLTCQRNPSYLTYPLITLVWNRMFSLWDYEHTFSLILVFGVLVLFPWSSHL